MELLAQGAGGDASGQIWIENHPEFAWAPGRVDSLEGKEYLLVDEHGTQFKVLQEKARPVDSACLRGVDDLLSLGDFNEGALLHNIRVRYFKDQIYTGIGNPILISVNPYASLPIYTEAKMKFYRDKGAAKSSGAELEIPPHLFSVGDSAYMAMLGDGKNQSIIISGESGAGKTEATKRILAYFASLQSADSSQEPSGEKKMSIEQQVLRSNPILEAFGNAKTLRNDNSSRFGKYIDIEFDAGGKLSSAHISNYLLEKCRIVQQQPGERGYHAFYFLCAGAPSMALNSTLHLHDASLHAYIGGLTTIDGVNDADEFEEMSDCMCSLGFSTEEKNSIFKVVAAVLHLGDLEFEELGGNDGSRICDQEKAAQICEMLEVKKEDFTKVFQFKTLEDPFTKKTIDMPQEPAASSQTRHSMSKVAYSRLFDWLVWRINQSTSGMGKRNANLKKIGILDIYGFEVFDWNSFEQLCINFANEKLQQHFNSHMFTLEQALYTEEGISWSHITWQDNKDIIDNLEKKPLGLFCIVDSECLMPNATDNTALSKIYASFKTSKVIYKPSRFASTNFAVAHYAGEVIYDIVSFLEKNTDKLHQDIITLLKSSGNVLIKTLFTDPKFAPEAAAAGGAASRKTSVGGPAAKAGSDRAKSNVTVSMMFRQQLDKLVDDLNKTNPRYIRCVKPNPNKEAREFDAMDIQRQLRCAGMLESIRIRRAGYPIRKPFKEFYNRFRVLCPHVSTAGKVDPDYKELCRRILSEMEGKLQADKVVMEAKSYQVGRSKVFIKDELQAELEKRIGRAVQVYVIRVQKRWIGYKARKRFKEMRKSSVVLQVAMRTLKAVLTYRAEIEKKKAAIVLQASMRMVRLRIPFARCRLSALTIQRILRGWLSRRRVGKLKGKAAADRIQKMREDEERKVQLENAQQDAKEQAKKMEEMQAQLAAQQSKQNDEAKKAMEEQDRQRLERQKAEEEQAAVARHHAREKSNAELEQMKQEMLELKKVNARMEGERAAAEAAPAGGSTSDEVVEQLRRELQDARRDKVKFEVELATAKSAEDYDAQVQETHRLREEVGLLRRGKLDAENSLREKMYEVDSLQHKVSKGDLLSVELTTIKAAHDDLQIEHQKVTAQKHGIETRLQAEESSKGELRELRMEKMRIEGELEIAQMKEQAMAEKLKNSEKVSADLTQQKTRVTSLEAELEASRATSERLKEHITQVAKTDGSARTESLDKLRAELLSRIESSKPKASEPQPASLGAAAPEGARNVFADEGGRPTMVNQREMFEKIRKQLADQATSHPDEPVVEVAADTTPEHVRDLEEQLRKVRKENVELQIRVTSLEDDIKEKGGDASDFLHQNSALKAEVEDSKFELEQKTSAVRRLTDENSTFQTRLLEAEGEVASLRRRLPAMEERLVSAEEDTKAKEAKIASLEEERDDVELRCTELRKQAADAAAREKSMETQLIEARLVVERLQKAYEDAERGRVEVESSTTYLTEENERLRGELEHSNEEKLKFKQVLDDVVNAQDQTRNEELSSEIDKWRSRASHFEREYNQAKQLNKEMTDTMMSFLNDRDGKQGDASEQNLQLRQQLESKTLALKNARIDKDEVQKQLDSLQSTGAYFQDKYKVASNELRILKQEHSVDKAAASKLRVRVETLQQENEDFKAQLARATATPSNEGQGLEVYQQRLAELQDTVRDREGRVHQTQAKFQRSQEVNDCLNTLLALESEQTSLYEASCSVADPGVRGVLDARKSEALHVVSRLNEIMNGDDSPVATGRGPSLQFQAANPLR